MKQDESPSPDPPTSVTFWTGDLDKSPSFKTPYMGNKGRDKHKNFLHSYKDHIIFGKEVKILEKFKKINDI